MNKVRLIVTSIISIVLVSILLIGSTYSIFTTTEIDEELNVYKTGDLNIKYSSNNVKITDTTPMTIEEADAVIPHRITVTNSGNVPYMFDVILSDTTSSGTNTIDYQYIMTKVGYLTPKKLSNCTNNIIKEDVIILPGEVVDIDIRVWLSDNLSNSEIGKSFYAKLSIDGQAIYNDNEEIDNSILSLRYMKNTSGSFNFNDIEYKTYIKEASFVDYIDTSNASIDTATNEKIIWDMSEKQDNSVVAWLESNTESEYYNLYIGSNYKIYAKSLASFFSGMSTLSNITFNNLSTSLTTTMSSTFFGCSKLDSLDLSNFDTSNVTHMGFMFRNCNNLASLNVSTFDTSKVTNIQNMFRECNNLIELDLSSFDISNVTTTERMFTNCVNLISLDVSSFGKNEITDMTNMFENCKKLEIINLTNFDTSNSRIMVGMFFGCNSLIELDLSNWYTQNVIDMGSMFNGCSSLIELDLSSFDTSNVTGMWGMFMGCSNLEKIDLSSFDTSRISNLDSFFKNCNSLVDVDLSNFDTSNVTVMGSMFNGCRSLTELDLSNFDTSKLIDTNYMFNNCNKLITAITIRNVSVTNYGSMFWYAATQEGAQIIVNYIPDNPTTENVNESTEAIVDAMIATGTGNIVKGCYGTNCPVQA